jgi:hypothetical protein
MRPPRTIGLLVVAAAVAFVPAASAKPATSRHSVDVVGMTKSTGSPSPGVIEDQGTVTGKPFGAGTIKVLATFVDQDTMTGTFKIHTSRGSASGTVDTQYVIEGNEITFTGTAAFTGGTGRYKGITGKKLDAYDHNTLDGQSGEITLKGFARF